MSFSSSALQYNSAFKPVSLCNWEVSANREIKPVARPPGFRTVFIVDDNGHLLGPKRLTSFTTGYEGSSSKRWPRASTAPHGGAATMGYKGIQTHYLPTSTVYMRNNPDSDEFNVSPCQRTPALKCPRF